MENIWKTRNQECSGLKPEQEALALEVTTQIAEKWTLSTLAVLAEEGAALRFSGLQARVDGINQKSLTKTLRKLERDGFVRRVLFPEVPPRVEYTITSMGLGLLEQIHPLWLWTVANVSNFEKSRRDYDTRLTRQQKPERG